MKKKSIQFAMAILAILIVVGMIVVAFNISPLEYGVPQQVQTVTKGFGYSIKQGTFNSNDALLGPNPPLSKPTEPWFQSGGPGANVWGREFISAVNDQCVVTAWNPKNEAETSEMITLTGTVAQPVCTWPLIAETIFRGPSRYYYKVYLYDQNNPNGILIAGRSISGTGINTEPVYFNYDYVQRAGGTTYPTQGVGPWANIPKFTMSSDSQSWPCNSKHKDEAGNSYDLTNNQDMLWSVYTHENPIWFSNRGYYAASPNQFSFAIKGHHVGYLKCEYWVEELKCTGALPCDSDFIPYKIQEDNVYLASGTGDFSIRNSAGAVQSTFEEGDHVKFYCDTDYSGGINQDPTNGWHLRLFNQNFQNDSNEYKEQSFPKLVPDGSRGYIADFQVPAGAFDSTKDNIWRAELWNNLFDQKIEYFFSVDSYDKCPGVPTVNFSKPAGYDAGENVLVTVRAQANNNGSGTIAKFFVEAYYQENPTRYLFDPQYITDIHSEGDGWYHATFNFTNTIGDKIAEIRAWSNDGEGRQSINYGVSTYLSKNPDNPPGTNTVAIIVKDSKTMQPILGATVSLDGGQDYVTGLDGKALFGAVGPGDHEVVARKAGYRDGSAKVMVVTTDIIKDVYLKPESSTQGWLIPLLAFAVVFAIFLCLAIYARPPYRQFLLVIGVVLAAVVACAVYVYLPTILANMGL